MLRASTDPTRSPAGPTGPRSSFFRRAAIVTIVALSVGAVSCRSIEKSLPYLVVAGGAIASVVALNYLSDCTSEWAVCSADPFTGEEVRDLGYTEQVLMMIGTITTVGGAAADYWVEAREKQRELARLDEVEQRVEQEYAQLQGGPPVSAWGAPPQASPGATRWGQAPSQNPGYGWAQAQPNPQGAPPYGGPPGSGAPGAGAQAMPPQAGGPPHGMPKGVQPRSFSEPMAIDTALLKRAGNQAIPVPDNDILFDGIGESIRDEFRVLFSPNQEAWVYVVGIDAVGRAQPLYPQRFPDDSNPIRPGEKVLLPSGDDWYGLDQYTGLQHVYFYVSPERDENLEKQFAVLASKPPPEPSRVNGQVFYVDTPTVLQYGRTRTKGLVLPTAGSALRIPGDAAIEIPTARVTGTVPGEPIVATRVFQHQ